MYAWTGKSSRAELEAGYTGSRGVMASATPGRGQRCVCSRRAYEMKVQCVDTMMVLRWRLKARRCRVSDLEPRTSCGVRERERGKRKCSTQNPPPCPGSTRAEKKKRGAAEKKTPLERGREPTQHLRNSADSKFFPTRSIPCITRTAVPKHGLTCCLLWRADSGRPPWLGMERSGQADGWPKPSLRCIRSSDSNG